MSDPEWAFEESKLTLKAINRIKNEVKREFPHDQMMCEFHIIRLWILFDKDYWKPKFAAQKSK